MEKAIDLKVIKGEKREYELKEKISKLLVGGASRKELSVATGSSDRVVRDIVSQIAKEQPVVVMEDGGYKLVNLEAKGDEAKEEAKLVVKTYKDLISRANEIVKRATILQNAMEILKVREECDG